jgi:hypothetical protein
LYLRHLSRETWRYFDDFVSAETHFLPPDNYQEKLRVEVAYRTSPTNIGFYMMSILSAHRLSYITLEGLAGRLHEVAQTLKKLERVDGHFLNWYDIKNLDPLSPRYVSTVDSGNLLASLWSSEQKCREILHEPVLQFGEFYAGIQDTFILLKESVEHKKTHLSLESINDWITRLKESSSPSEFVQQVDSFEEHVRQTIESNQDTHLSSESKYWWKKLHEQLLNLQQWRRGCIPWIKLLNMPIAKSVSILHPEGSNGNQ